MYVNYMIVPVAAFEYSMARKLVNCKPSIPVSEKNRKEQILFPLFHTEIIFIFFYYRNRQKYYSGNKLSYY